MTSFDLDFFPRDDARGDEYSQFDWQLESFLSSLWRNGNVVGDYWILNLTDRVQARITSPAPDAMEFSNWSVYAFNDWERLAALLLRPTVIAKVEEKETAPTWCNCSASPFYLLYSTWETLPSPMRCGACALDVPLYRLPICEPPNGAQDASRFVNWKSDHVCLDLLWLHSGVGERYATRQLQRPKSKFMVQTRQLAADLEEKSGIPTYSFLKHYYLKWGKRCPLCARKWRWKNSPREQFAFKCDHCRLISSEASGERTPLSKLHP